MDSTPTKNAYAQLMEQGFVVIPRALDDAHCERMLAGIDAFKREHQTAVASNADEFGHLYRVVNMHLAIGSVAAELPNSTRSTLATCT
jgi:phytanoyl-CoA hydroxylase